MYGVQQISFAGTIVSRKNINPFAKSKPCFRVIFKIDDWQLL